MKRVALIVDDSVLVRRAVSRFLLERGYEVQSATDGSQALQAIDESAPDVIVADLLMAKVSGREFVATLKRDRKTSKIPIIIVAGRRGAGPRPELLADYIVYKDVDIIEQLERTFAVLNRLALRA